MPKTKKGTPEETLGAAIQSLFKGERTLYFHSSDAMKALAGDTYLKYDQRRSSEAVIWVCGDDGEAIVKVCHTAADLRRLIEAILW